METTNSWNNLDFQRKLRHVPRVCANVSQMVCPLPSSFTAPSYCKQSHHIKALEYSFEDRSASLSLATACLDAPPRFPANRRGTPTPSRSRSFRPSMGAIIFISQTNQWEAYASATHNCWIADLKLLDRAKLNFESEERTDSPMGVLLLRRPTEHREASPHLLHCLLVAAAEVERRSRASQRPGRLSHRRLLPMDALWIGTRIALE
jgi:hypothetical protein